MREWLIRKRSIVVFIIVFTFFSGNYAGYIPGIAQLLMVVGNLGTVYMLLDVLSDVIKSRNFSSYTRISIGYAVFTLLYYIICIANSNATGLISNIKSIIVIFWIDKTIKQDKSIMEDAIRLAFYLWCIMDSIFTIMHPEGVHFLVGGEYILGGKNNKVFFIFIAEILSIYKFYKLKSYKERILFALEWGLFTVLCFLNINIIKSSTTLMIIIIVIIFPAMKNILRKSLICKPLFVCVFHICIFIVLIFVRELFQDQLDSIMQILFEKDATFTGRIYIWRAALVEIANNLFIGLGDYNDIPAVLQSGYVYMWSMSHNEVLEILLRGGLCLFTVWLYILGILIHRLRMNGGHILGCFSTYALFAILFFFHTEASIAKIIFFVFLLLYHMSEEVAYLEES